jgi:FlaA1/EpsC-like NDP-sugar epimerase
MSGVSSGFSIARLKQSFFSDQKAIWTSPLHLPSEDNSRLAAWGIGTLLLVAADKPIMRHLESTPMAHSSSLSTFGIAALAGGGAAFFLLGSATNDAHSRETGFLAGETAVDSIVVAEAMKFTFQRPRPNAANAGRFGAGGASFPSEHALAAWSMASVLAQEYPGPLTKLLVYGAASGISDVLDILKAIATGSIAFLLFLRYGMGVKAFPLSVYALEALLSFTLLSFTLLSGIRIFSRMLVETVRRDSASKRLLVVGAGRAAQMIIRETQELESGYQVIGCVDDNPLKAGLRVLGVPVFGPVADLVEVVDERSIDEVLIAIPSATPNEMRRVVALCKQSTATFRTVPALAELIAGRVTLQQVREVSLTDLLGRIPIDLDLEPVREHIRDRVVMVTGAAGSIGSELCRQIGTYQPKLLICLDQNETGIFHLQHQLTQGEIDERKIFCVADFCNPERMRKVFAAHDVEIVFHAAAYKHVPVMESNVEEAVSNNVFGLLALLNVAENSKCSTFVMISSDKAVNPTNVMGCTKRLGELILAAWPGERLRCVSVRFGNVLGSSGSVIPLFQEQIRQNQPITITHPEITRFFMTISEAVSLVLQAFAIGRHRDILVLDMGEPVRVAELAKTLARLSGKTGQEFKIIGLRPGEKLFEELFYADERVFPSPCQKIACTESIKLGWPALKNALDELYVAVSLGERESILAHLQRIVPQFSFEGLKHAPSIERANAMESISLNSGSPHGPPATEAVERRLLPYPAWPATTPGHAQRDKRLLGPAAGD